MDTTKEILKKYWGFDSFRPKQEGIINDLKNGKDVFALLPTGGGKSLCYQLPGLMKEGITIVISPLISLMQDQVNQLNQKGIKAICINSGMSYREIDNTLDNVRFGDYKFLYLSPERLQTKIFIERFKLMKIGFIVVDEAHCISQWGHDFRPSYKQINQLRHIEPDIPIAAFTATATKHTKEDIIKELELKRPEIHEASFVRENIAYRIFKSETKKRRIIEFCSTLPQSTGIIYCQTRKSVKEVSQLLNSEKISCASYHGGMNKEDREKAMKSWMDESSKIMVATNAFGMGIDKPNVRFVIHYEISESIEAYFQEAGRAGRDQKKAIALAFYSKKDLENLDKTVELKYPLVSTIKKVYTVMCNILRIAYGSGKDELYEFNLMELCKRSEVDPLTAFNALRILEMNQMISMSDAFAHPSRLKILVEMNTLYHFEIEHENLKDITQFLIRKIPGVFDTYKRIDYHSISGALGKNKTTIKKELIQLQKSGVIDYIPATSQPSITFLKERPPHDDFLIHPDIYTNRKKSYLKQIQEIQKLLKGSECNSKMVLTYFGQDSESCGHCNHCMNKKHKKSKINQLLIDQCTNKTTVASLMNITGLPESLINTSLNEMINDELVSVENGWIQKID